MKKTTKLPNYYYRIGLVMVLLFAFASSNTKDMPMGVTERNQEFIREAKSFSEIEMNKNTENVFLQAFRLKSD